ncbi:hypothetical protein LTR36_004240 [Oleoguttula mirabilis]|uniref:F-box domain-containing protein n=1 Tax=Oleoguttula mirabilis TaxID=1507867 RepID=A0AAV9JGH1_9PEZI|nr:hypothetical protein LTR36_004240 [Oleoguttula mirabilis]
MEATRATAAAVEQEEYALLTLPLELRNSVYHLALLGEARVSIDGQQDAKKQLPRFAVLGLLRVCKKVAQEASGIWCSNTIFYYEQTPKLLEWLQLLGRGKCRLLRTVRCSQCFENTDSAEWYLRQLKALLETEATAMCTSAVWLKCRLKTKSGTKKKVVTRYLTRAAAITAKS